MIKQLITLFLTIFILQVSTTVLAEPLVIYDLIKQRDSSNKLLTDKEIYEQGDKYFFRKQTYRLLNPNSPSIGNSNDCYPDDPNNPKGNIVIRGRVASKFDGKSVNGAVVAVYMGMEHTNNNNANKDRFVIGDGGKLINFYSYDITDDGFFEVYACNDFKKLSNERSDELGAFCPDGYYLDPSTNKCSYYDYVDAFPKFYVAVICGMVPAEEQTRIGAYMNRELGESSQLKPWIGEVLSIDNFNEPYLLTSIIDSSTNKYKKTLLGSRPDFLVQDDFDLKVNCGSNIQPFPVPMFLNYTATNDVSSCRMDDINPELVNYMVDTQKSLLTQPTPSVKPFGVTNTLPTPVPTFPASITPSPSFTDECLPGDLFCPKNFITSVFKPPRRGETLFSYRNKNYLENSSSLTNANMALRFNVLGYDSPKFLLERTIDFENGNDISDGTGDYLSQKRNRSTQGQVDAKLDVASAMTDLKFDISILKDMYSCFTSFNHPNTRSSAQLDEVLYGKTPNVADDFYFSQNVRIPSCRELYCASGFTPDPSVCKIKVGDDRFGTDVMGGYIGASDKYISLSAMSGYGPALTALPADTSVDKITGKLMRLSLGLINSEFNPKKALVSGAKYKQVNKLSDIPACRDDAGNVTYLDEGGSISYRHHTGVYNFQSPVPFMSFLSIPYFSTYLHSIGNDNYANKNPASNQVAFNESCQNGNLDTNPDQQFAQCSSAMIPGGAYSLFALNLIADMCNDNLRIGIPGATTFDYVNDGTGVVEGYSPKGFEGSFSKRVDLAVTKIGTPTSLCLCDPYDLKNCSDQNKLNNYLTNLGRYEGLTQKRDSSGNISYNVPNKGYAVGSFIGSADQWVAGGQISNTIGELCEKSKGDSRLCNERLGSARDIAGTQNFLGPNDILNANWRFSYEELSLARTDLTWKMYLHYTTQPGSGMMSIGSLGTLRTNNPPFKVFAFELDSSVGQDITDGLLERSCTKWMYVGQECTTNSLGRESCEDRPVIGLEEYCTRGNCIAGIYDKPSRDNGLNHKCVEWEAFVWNNPREENVSNISRSEQELSAMDGTSAGRAKTNTPFISYLTDEAYKNPSVIQGSPTQGVEGNFRLIQQSEDGTKGYVTATFEYFNEKYDPIPSILNRFKSLSTWAIIPGGDMYCRTPKIASLASFDTFELVTNQTNVGGTDLTGFTDSRGVSCNAMMEEDLKKCDTGEDVTPDDFTAAGNRSTKKYTNTPEIECKFRKCLQMCNQLYSSYYFYDELTGEGKEPQFFCANKYPKTKNVQMEFNSGDEGCVVDYFAKMKEYYQLPFISNPSSFGLRNLKVEYPVYNNQLCLNPTNPVNINDTAGPLADNKSCPVFLNNTFSPKNQVTFSIP